MWVHNNTHYWKGRWTRAGHKQSQTLYEGHKYLLKAVEMDLPKVLKQGT